jgi:hypothetical protein
MTKVSNKPTRSNVRRDESDRMKLYRLYKKSVLPLTVRNQLLERNYRRLQGICSSPYAKRLGDEALSIINEISTMTARTFDPSHYVNPRTHRRFTTTNVDTTDEELNRLFYNYLAGAINRTITRQFEKRRHEVELIDDILPGRECDPSFLAELGESISFAF